MSKHHTGFIRVRAYGNRGDMKCDGLFRRGGMFFQVYSPDKIALAKVKAKIEGDLHGAVNHWRREIKEWTFVYNVREGVAAPVIGVLFAEARRYPEVRVSSMSHDELWELAKELSAEQLREVLGPSSLDLRDRNSKSNEGDDARVVIVHDLMTPIDVSAAVEALRPERPLGAPVRLWPAEDERAWKRAAGYQERVLGELLTAGRSRFAVFSLSPIALAIHLGFVLSDRTDVKSFQWDRERCSWSWMSDAVLTAGERITVRALPAAEVIHPADVLIRIGLSAPISALGTRAAVRARQMVAVDLTVPHPNVMWLLRPEQLLELSSRFREVLHAVEKYIPEVQRIHLFYAGPTPGAIALGQAINPRMAPPTLLYQYQRPRYKHVLTLRMRAQR